MSRTTWRAGAFWTLLFSALVGWAVYRLGIFPLTGDVPLEGTGSFPRAFFTIDHPFHTARAGLLRDAWAKFDTVRWVANHQGGYPAEFYPFGVAAIAAFFSILSFGHLAIESAWAITIALIFVLPGVAFVLIGRVDRRSPAIAVIALAGQLAIASDWTHGGFTELVEWGLATNVAGFAWALVTLPLLVGATRYRSPALLAASVVVIAMCAVSNPRSLLAVAVIGVAILVEAVSRRQLRRPVLALLVTALLAAGLAAPVLVPLVRYRDLYFFLSYQEYAGLGAYLSATVDAVTWPVLALAAVGTALAIARPRHRAARVAALSLLLYMLITALAVVAPWIRDLVPQLELPRLMPFQRMLVLWLAASGVVEMVRFAIRLPTRQQLLRDGGLAGVATLVLLLVFASDVGPFPNAEQGLRHVPKTSAADAAELVQFENAITRADDTAPDGSAILVIGSRLSWHEQLWGPMAAPDRRFYYNDWLWYWHHRHDGPYDYRQGHFYPNPSEALARDYLDAHGIGAVVITDIADRDTGADARRAASRSDELDLTETIGAWDVYAVRNPVGLAMLNGEPADAVEVSEDGERVSVTFENAAPGTINIRQNWFPRWQWILRDRSGLPEQPARSANGYMEIETQVRGDIHLELRYALTSTDAIARVASMASVLVVVMLFLVTPIRRWGRR